jgi:hypothetical protein
MLRGEAWAGYARVADSARGARRPGNTTCDAHGGRHGRIAGCRSHAGPSSGYSGATAAGAAAWSTHGPYPSTGKAGPSQSTEPGGGVPVERAPSETSRGAYGVPRVHATPRRGGRAINRKRKLLRPTQSGDRHHRLGEPRSGPRRRLPLHRGRIQPHQAPQAPRVRVPHPTRNPSQAATRLHPPQRKQPLSKIRGNFQGRVVSVFAGHARGSASV